ncbi:MAG: signal peptidase I [Clostridiales bacterium]|nr:signal peptidase I [Clostridiales bacterium]
MENGIKILKEVLSWLIVLVIALLAAAFVNSHIFAMATVQEVSMQDTLYANQALIINRRSYKNKSPEKGDIIVFYLEREIGSSFHEFGRSIKNIIPFMGPSKEESRDRLVKRVIATAGDVIDIKDGEVYLNDQLLDEPYIKGITEESSVKYPVTVGEGQLFVMGDNREHSSDSRNFGLIDVSHVEGKATFRIFPFNKFGKLN